MTDWILHSERRMDRFNARRKESTEVLQQLIRVAEALEFHRAAEMLSESVQSLTDDHFEVLVVGEFSNGKSTFINALLGRELLASSIKPCTALLTRVQYGSEQEIRLIRRDGEEERVTEDQFKQLIAPDVPDETEEDRSRTRRQAERISEIAYADIRLPTQLGSDGIVLVDSPGTNDMDAAREAITNRYIPNCDAVIFVIHGLKPFTQSERSFLQRIKDSDIRKIFFVINFKDQLATESDRERVLERVRREAGEVLPSGHFYLVSSRHELLHRLYPGGVGLPPQRKPLLEPERTGFDALQSGLQRFLVEERGAAKLDKPLTRAIRTADDLIRHSIEFERRTLRHRIEEAQQVVVELRSQLERARNQGISAVEGLRVRLRKDDQKLVDEYREGLRSIHRLAKDTMDKSMNHHGQVSLAKEAIEKAVGIREKELQTDLERQIAEVEERVLKRAASDMQLEFGKYEELLEAVLKPDGASFSSFSSSEGSGEAAWKTPFARLIADNPGAFAASLAIGGFTGLLYEIGSTISRWGKKIFDFFTGNHETPRDKLQRELNERFLNPIAEKCKELERHLAARSESLSDGLEREIERSVEDSEKQLRSLLRNQRLTQEEVRLKLEELDLREREIQRIAAHLKTLREENREDVAI